ncbi:MAG TPA: alpha/beta hydrolase [Acidimicrobiia bacterium]|jgi:pimeloyl-ACP methyl ester carboxylesterase
MVTFGLVHGAWHGAWCWDLLRPELENLGHRAVAVDLACEDWTAGLDVNATIVGAALEDAEGDVVLVGHSLGGITIPVVTARLPVAQLVFLCALVPEPGRSLDETMRAGPPSSGKGWTGPPVVHADGSASWEPEAAVAAFYHDCRDDVARWAASKLRRQVWTTTREPCPLERWPDIPSSYILCTEDKPVGHEWARWVARERLGVEAVELPGGHFPMLSRPRQLAVVLAQLAGDD